MMDMNIDIAIYDVNLKSAYLFHVRSNCLEHFLLGGGDRLNTILDLVWFLDSHCDREEVLVRIILFSEGHPDYDSLFRSSKSPEFDELAEKVMKRIIELCESRGKSYPRLICEARFD